MSQKSTISHVADRWFDYLTWGTILGAGALLSTNPATAPVGLTLLAGAAAKYGYDKVKGS